MKILALEMSSARGSLAWRENDDTGFTREWPNDRQNSGAFFENLKLVSEKFGRPDKIIVGLGPGSYAGTRIAISAAIGLSVAGGTGAVPSQNLGRHGGRPSIGLIGYPSICAIESEADEYCVVGDARRQSFFFARVCQNDLLEGPALLTETEVRDRLNILEATMSIFSSDQLPQFQRVQLRHPSAELLARLAQEGGHSFASPPLEPIYLREPHITNPQKPHDHTSVSLLGGDRPRRAEP
jgi:tRNA threonylcarbamoyladenosine biosynthesis protein TsaB